MELHALDDEPAWIDAARFATKVWRHPKTQSTLFIGCCTCALTAAALHTGTYYTPTADVIVYCLIYSLWLTICLPWLVKNLNKKTVLLVAGVLFRLCAAEIGVLAWGLLRGHGHFLQRALRMKPLLEPSLLWLAEAGYNIRYGVIVSAVVAAILVTFTSAIENYSRGCNSGKAESEGFSNPGVNHRKNVTSHVHFRTKNQEKKNQEKHPRSDSEQDKSMSNGHNLPADDLNLLNSTSEWCGNGRHHSPAISLTNYERTSGRNSTSPHGDKISFRKDKLMGIRNSKTDVRDKIMGIRNSKTDEKDRIMGIRNSKTDEKDTIMGIRNSKTGEKDRIMGIRNSKTDIKDRIMGARNNKSDSAPMKAQESPPSVESTAFGRDCKFRSQNHALSWEAFSSCSSQTDVESFTLEEGDSDDQDENVAASRWTDPLKTNCRGYDPRASAIEFNSNHQSALCLPSTVGLLGPPKVKPKVRHSSSCASSNTTDQEFVNQRGQTGRYVRSGRSSCPTELKSSPNDPSGLESTTRESKPGRINLPGIKGKTAHDGQYTGDGSVNFKGF
ncbi:hypothetical protein EGW08_005164, partial [Elysia chlorotica]